MNFGLSHKSLYCPSYCICDNLITGLFFVAYKNWNKTYKDGLTLKEMSEDFLNDRNEINNTLFVSEKLLAPASENSKNKFCILFCLSSGDHIQLKITFTEKCPPGKILLSPTTLNNVASVMRKSQEVTLKSKYIFKICDTENIPHIAQSVKLQAIQCPLLQSIPLEIMDEILKDFFSQDSLHFCRYLSLKI